MYCDVNAPKRVTHLLMLADRHACPLVVVPAKANRDVQWDEARTRKKWWTNPCLLTLPVSGKEICAFVPVVVILVETIHRSLGCLFAWAVT